MKKLWILVIEILTIYHMFGIQLCISQTGIRTLQLSPYLSSYFGHNSNYYFFSELNYSIGRQDDWPVPGTGINIFRSMYVYDFLENIPQGATIYSVKLKITMTYCNSNRSAKIVALPFNTLSFSENDYNSIPSNTTYLSGIPYINGQLQIFENPGTLKDIVQYALNNHQILVLGAMSENESINESHAVLSMDMEIKYFMPTYRITVKNSFGGGEFWIGDQHFTNTNQNGNYRDLNYGQSYYLTAVDNQIFQNLNWRFRNWTKGNEDGSTNSETGTPLSISINQNASYTANFVPEYNITIQNNYSSLGNVGKMKFDGTEYDMPHDAFPITEDNDSKAFEAVTCVYNYIRYSFNHWSDN
jgi:hypothetical protein